jgi:hypothetical protein
VISKNRPHIRHLILSVILLVLCNWEGEAYSHLRIIQPVRKMSSAVLIVIDSVSYSHVAEPLGLYRDAIEMDGLSAYILIDEWKDPSQIRDQIKTMIQDRLPIEGVILVGDIPIPMILDAQHLTSAFKIDQARYSRIRTAVPSDRFYDDLDLVFNYLEQDSTNPLLFYYSLSADSPQKIESEMYSGRIMPGVKGDEKYLQLNRYLSRIAQQKRQKNPLNHAMVVSGHGYHSESLTAWADEYQEMREHLPSLFNSGGDLIMLYHQMDFDLKRMTLLQLQQPELDLAIFHAHGNEDAQYLAGLPEGNSVQENIEAIKYYLRSKLRQAQQQKKSVEETMADFKSKLDVPESWFAGAFTDSSIISDSLLNYGLDIHVADIRQIFPQAEFMILDQCFNGAFIHAPYIAGEYVFGKGTTIAAAANSVNIIQDLWIDQNLGLLTFGTRVGKWNQQRNYLETHIIGDPTFHFTPESSYPGKPFWQKEVISDKTWQKYLKQGPPSLRALAVQELYRSGGQAFESNLVQIYQDDPAFIVRLQALQCLAELRSPTFENILELSVTDPFELIRRFTVKWMGDIGKEKYLPYLLNNLMLDPAKRVNTNSWDAISKIGSSRAIDMVKELPADHISKEIIERLHSQAYSDSNWIYNELLTKINNDTLDLKKRISAARTFRYYRFQEIVPHLLQMLQDREQPEILRVTIAEALGWYGMNYQRNIIVHLCQKQLAIEPEHSAVAREIYKTIQRLETGPNNVMTP